MPLLAIGWSGRKPIFDMIAIYLGVGEGGAKRRVRVNWVFRGHKCGISSGHKASSAWTGKSPVGDRPLDLLAVVQKLSLSPNWIILAVPFK